MESTWVLDLSLKTFLTFGHNMEKNTTETDISVNMDGGVGGSWKEVTNKVIADNLLEQVAELLNAKSVRYFTCCDRTEESKKIIIEYDHKKK
jgi:hypothetical protein